MDKLEAVQEIMRLSIEINGVDEDRFAMGRKPCVMIHFLGSVGGLSINVYRYGLDHSKKADYNFFTHTDTADIEKLTDCIEYLEAVMVELQSEAA
ncbi:MAG: hypothetical protein CVU99_02645 [Firmicutes bacterium HGW-Firmicutes-4]|jgi:hypothetical protein|nr:MAG: hypothetical protein CVU99_02645 [Firmicutes bacterium HGW-Firmicutes-4]